MCVCAVYIGESVIDCSRAGLGVNCRAVNRTICILICALHSRQEAGEAGHAIDVPRGRQGGAKSWNQVQIGCHWQAICVLIELHLIFV